MVSLERRRHHRNNPPFTPQQRAENSRRVLLARWHTPEFAEWRRTVIESRRQYRHSESSKRTISRGNSGKVRTVEMRKEMSKSKGGIWNYTLLFFRRGWANADVARLGFDKRKVQNAKTRLRRAGLLERPSSTKEVEQEKQRVRKTLTEDEINGFNLARKFLEKGLVTDDLSAYSRLQTLYRNHNRTLPQDPEKKLRLEVFLRALQRSRRGDNHLRNLYKHLGEQVAPFWFYSNLREEESFIIDHLPNPLGYAEDNLGYYRMINGKKFRPIVEFGNEEERNGIIFDSSSRFAERENNRRRIKVS